jgi:uncharacterized protein (DUF1778 family)
MLHRLLYNVFTADYIPTLEVAMAQARTKDDGTERRSLINLRVTPEDRRLIDRAASVTGKNRSEFMLDAARHAAEEALLEKVLFRVDTETFGKLLAQLDAPPSANDALRKLMQTKAPWEN